MTQTASTIDAPPWRALYPFQSYQTDVEGWKYHYLDEPPSSSGAGQSETVLCVHGNPTWSFHWRTLIAACRDRCRVVAPDHLGCGLSDKPPLDFRLADRIRHLTTLVESLDLHNITLVAHDWGGAIGLGAALKAPERYARFVLLNTGAFRPWFIPWRIRVCRTPVVGRLALQGANLFSLAALRMTTTRPAGLSSAVQAGYLAPYDCWSARRAVYQFVRDIPLSASHPTWQTLETIESQLPTLCEKPVQLIWGMQDWCFTPACLDKFVEIFPTAEVVRHDQAGHWVLEDLPEQVCAEIRDFIGRHSRPDDLAIE